MLMNYNLYVFTIVAETGSLSAASKQLFVSQPAISQAIKKLEKEIGTPLLIRNTKAGILLTEAGKKILSYARQMHSLEDLILQLGKETSSLNTGNIRIGIIPFGGSDSIFRIFSDFRASHPKITFSIEEHSAKIIEEKINNWELDIGITIAPPNAPFFIELMKDQLISVHAKERKTIDLTALPSDLIISNVTLTLLERLSNIHRSDLNGSIILNNHNTMLDLVAYSDKTALISERIFSKMKHKLEIGYVFPEVKTSLGILTNDYTSLSPAALHLCHEMGKEFHNVSPALDSAYQYVFGDNEKPL